MISPEMSSSAAWTSPASRFGGRRRRASMWNSGAPECGSALMRVSKASMLTCRRLSMAVTWWTMPGWSWPTRLKWTASPADPGASTAGVIRTSRPWASTA